jgi:drug/metabolite transporter (DMT)-like permease
MKKNYLLLHFIILLWGFTPVLGKLISLEAYDLVWFRLAISIVSLYIFLRIKGVSLKINYRDLLQISAIGFVVGIHWFFFYHTIKVSNVSVALAGFSTITLFASMMEPVILKKKFFWGDLIYGVVIALGLLVILNFEADYFWGVFYGILAAVTSAYFGVYNGKLILKNNAGVITLVEFLSAFALISILKYIDAPDEPFFEMPGWSDWIFLLILGILCTTVAFTLSVEILKQFSPLTVIITNNLEPIYGIVFSLLIFKQSEYMSAGFYMGTSLILISVFTYPFIAAKFKEK